MAALQVEAVRFGILRMAFDEALFFRLGELQAQSFRDFVGDFVLNDKDVAGLAIELGTPELSSGGDIDEFSANAERAAALHHPAGENGADIELAADGLGVDGLALVAEHRALRDDAKARHGGEDVDEARWDAVAEIFVFGIASAVFKRKDGKRADDFCGPGRTKGSGSNGGLRAGLFGGRSGLRGRYRR